MKTSKRKIRRLLVANRGEIAIRVFRAATELGITTIGIYSQEDRFSLHRFKADESYLVGVGKKPVDAYLDIADIIRAAKEAHADAIHPGYGFLSENPDFAEACAEAGLLFIGPSPETMRKLGNKVSARELAIKAGITVMPATAALPHDDAETAGLAAKIGFPIMLKASWGGGGRGMRVVESADQLLEQLAAARREAKSAFGNDEVYAEKLVRRARHVEVQILGDGQGNIVHLYERDCSVQRRHQKVVERAPAAYLSAAQREQACEAALKIARAAHYRCAGTVEFLQNVESGEFYFIEVNPRIQVEHTVTEMVTGIDLVKAQIRITEGALIGTEESGVPAQDSIRLNGHAMQCRVTTEDPENNFIPDYGRITAYRSASGFGVRLDAGTAYTGAVITRFYDSLLVKVTTWAPSPVESVARMGRTLSEFRIRGVASNLRFLEALIHHPNFQAGDYTTRFIDETPELFRFPKRRDRATRVLRFIGDVMVNGNPEVKGRPEPQRSRPATAPHIQGEIRDGAKQLLERKGAKGVASWMLEQKKTLITDTTFRDAHQSLIATRMRSHDMLAVAPAYARLMPDLFSVECWGGATFDVAMRFLKECPWERLAQLRERMPNLLLQMLLRASNAVGYTNYPDNVVRHFIARAAETGVDVFRVFDSLNWVENMRVAIDAVVESGKICEAAICYTGDIFDPERAKYGLAYYVGLAKELEKTGAHILGIKDMAGLLKPAAAKKLVAALKQEIALPVHFHTHDTSGISAASVLAAIEAGCDAVDAAMDSMSGLTSQPNLGSIVAALQHTGRDSGLDLGHIRRLSEYWEQVRQCYSPFESDIRAGASEVYLHEMPGGQYTNLREQARSLGIEERWSEVAHAYAEVNRLFGDIIKVTPSSKVVGDMALVMVTGGLTAADIADPAKEVAFPDSVVSMFRGDLGQPPGGWPAALQAKILKGAAPVTVRPGSVMTPIDLAAAKAEAEAKLGRHLSENELSSYLMYPKVFADYALHHSHFGDVSTLPTPVFFHGMEVGQEIAVELEKGKALVIRYLATSDPDEEGLRTIFFELNGQPRSVKVADRLVAPARKSLPKAEDGNPAHVSAPMPGLVVSVAVKKEQAVKRGDLLLTIEAMKMETAVRAEADGLIKEIAAAPGMQVEAKDLLVQIQLS
jgi:pyruvate carboxylase